MSRVFPLLTAFNAGELSPKLKGRSDVARYHSGCRILENFIILPQGGVMRRPGTHFVHGDVGTDIILNGSFDNTDYWDGWRYDKWLNPNFYITSLVHFNTPGTTITDETGKTWTCGDNGEIKNTVSKIGGASYYTPGGSSYPNMATTPAHAGFNMADGDFTVACWAYRTGAGASILLAQCKSDGADASRAWWLGMSTFGIRGTDSNVYEVSHSYTAPLNEWHHYAGSRYGDTLYFFIDGVPVATADVTGITANSSTEPLAIGGMGAYKSMYQWEGYIDEAVVMKGISYWDYAGFTPPDEEFAYSGAAKAATHVAGGSSDSLTQDVTFTVGVTYEVVWTISGRTAGTVRVSLGGDDGADLDSNGTKTTYLTPTTTTVEFAVCPSHDFDGSVDSISCKPLSFPVRMVPFQFNTVQAYVLEFYHLGIRFYKDNGIIESAPGTPYSIVTPYTSDELMELKMVQSADVMYIVHTNHPVYKLSRTGHTSWTLAVETFTPTKYPISDVGNVGGIAYITCKAHPFSEGTLVYLEDVEGQIELNNNLYTVELPTSSAGDAANHFYLKGIDNSGYTAYTGGGTAVASPFMGAKKTITAITKANPGAVTCADHGYATNAIVMCEKVEGMTELNERSFQITVVDTDTFTIGEDTSGYGAYTSGGTVRSTIFNATDEYPAAVACFEERLCYGGTEAEPQTIWLSASNDWGNFTSDGTQDDLALSYTIGSDKVDRIRWLMGQDYLMVGTFGGVWRLGGATKDDPITPSSVVCKRQMAIGCKDLDAELVNDSVMYVQLGGLNLRTIAYSFERDKYVSPDLMMFADHIAKGSTEALSGIVDMDVQQEPFTIVWAVRADGQLLALTYEPDQQVFGWTRIVTDGVVKSVAVISSDGTEDQVWVSVERTIEGVTGQYVEYFNPHEFWGELEDAFFVDSGLSWDGGASVAITAITAANPPVVTAPGHDFSNGEKVRIWNVVGMTEVNIGLSTAYTVANSDTGAGTFELSGIDGSGWTAYTSDGYAQQMAITLSGLDHLEGESVAVLVDGVNHAACTVASGSITLSWYGNKIHAGLPYTSTIEPMPIEVGGQDGSSQSKQKRIHALNVRFYETGPGVEWGSDDTHLYTIPLEQEIFTGDLDYPLGGDYSNQATITISQDAPLPCTILSIAPKMAVY